MTSNGATSLTCLYHTYGLALVSKLQRGKPFLLVKIATSFDVVY
jgi:hypothetical protein